MAYKVKAFGIAKDIVGGRETVVETPVHTVGELRAALYARHPQLEQLRSLLFAVNHAYAEDHIVLQPGDEVALIPPVSGG